MKSLTETDFVIPRGTGKAFYVPGNYVLRIENPVGPQVADFNAVCADRPEETFSASYTRDREGSHLRPGAVLYSRPPFDRAMFRFVTDTVQNSGGGAAHHDLLFPCCSKAAYEAKFGFSRPDHCHDNLRRAFVSIGLDPLLVHDPANFFMKTGVAEDGRIYFADPDSKPGDYVELVALLPCYVALSACPGTSNGPGKDGYLRVQLRPAA